MDLSKRYDRRTADVLYPGKVLTYGQPYSGENLVSKNLILPPPTAPKGAGFKSKKKSGESSELGAYDYDSIYNSLVGSGSGGSSGGGVFKPDITALLNAYDQQNAAANAIAKAKYDASREDLLTAMNRAEQQNAIDTLRQNQTHIGNVSNLESTGNEASRNARIQTAMRGLSGSGIAQLNQLKNMLTQGSKASAVAQNNSEALNKLRQSLTTAGDNTNAGLEKALQTYTDAVSKANQAAGKNKGEAIWENESNYASALAKASASSGGSSDSDYREAANDIYTNLRNTTTSLQSSLNAIRKMSTKELKRYVLANNLGDSISTLAAINGDNISKLGKNKYRSYVEKALGQQSYDIINELNSTYGINPNTYTTAMGNISNLLYKYK